MPTASMLTLVDAIADDAGRIALAPADDAVRAQAALVRGLVDELAHRHPAEVQVVSLHEQLADELSRLATLVGEGSSFDSPFPVDVLLVEDDDATRIATARIVIELGYRCRATSSAEVALAEYERQRASIVLSDWQLSGMSGMELCRRLKHMDPHAYTILVTAFPDASNMLTNLPGGIDDFLPKPVDVDQLAARLEAAKRLVHVVRILESVKQRLFKRTAVA